MDPPPSTGELGAWLVALSVGAGIVLAVILEIWIRQKEWMIDDLRAEVERLKRERKVER